MITFILALAVVLLLSASLGLFKFKEYTDRYTKEEAAHNSYYNEGDFKGVNVAKLVKVALMVILLMVLNVAIPLGIQRIDAGNVGLKVDRVGNDKGIPVARPVKGWVFYNTWTTDVIEYSIRQFHIEYNTFTVTAKGGTLVPVKPSYNIYLKPEKAVDVYIHLLRGADLESLKSTWLATATTIAMKNVTNRFSPDSIFNHASDYQMAVEDELNKQLEKYFKVDQINPGQSPPASMGEILQAKANAVQAAQQAELNRQTAVAVAEQKIAEARGDSASAVITAAGEAEAIRLKTREVSPTYVEYVKWLNAAEDVPRVPATVLGSSSVLLSR